MNLQFDKRLLRIDLDRRRIGRWRGAFSDADKEAFKTEAGDLLIGMGYESGSAW